MDADGWRRLGRHYGDEGGGVGPTAIELSGIAASGLLPLPARNEWREGWGEGNPNKKRPSSPRPSPPFVGRRGRIPRCIAGSIPQFNSSGRRAVPCRPLRFLSASIRVHLRLLALSFNL